MLFFTEEESSGGEVEATESQESLGGGLSQDIKGMLMRKYSGYLSSLRKEFLKKRKKGKLPKDARMILLDWWNNHYRWPYPTVITVQLNYLVPFVLLLFFLANLPYHVCLCHMK